MNANDTKITKPIVALRPMRRSEPLSATVNDVALLLSGMRWDADSRDYSKVTLPKAGTAFEVVTSNGRKIRAYSSQAGYTVAGLGEHFETYDRIDAARMFVKLAGVKAARKAAGEWK